MRRASIRSTRLTWSFLRVFGDVVSKCHRSRRNRVSVTYLLALDEGVQRLDLEFNAHVLKAFVLVVDAKVAIVTIQLFVTTGRSLMLRFFRPPFLRFRGAVELVSDAVSTTRLRIDVGYKCCGGGTE